MGMKKISLTRFPKFVRHCYELHSDKDNWIDCFHAEGFTSVEYTSSTGKFLMSEYDYTFFVLKFS